MQPPPASPPHAPCASIACSTGTRRRIAEAGARARLHHVRVLAGELGAPERLNPGARLAGITTVRQAFNGRSGRALWGHHEPMGFALHLRGLDPQLLRAL